MEDVKKKVLAALSTKEIKSIWVATFLGVLFISVNTIHAELLDDYGLKHFYDNILEGYHKSGGHNIQIAKNGYYEASFKYPKGPEDMNTWKIWLFLEDIRTVNQGGSPGYASVTVFLDYQEIKTVYFSNYGKWAWVGPIVELPSSTDPSIPHTLRIINNYNDSIIIGDAIIRWIVNQNLSIPHLPNSEKKDVHTAYKKIISNIEIPIHPAKFTFHIQFPVNDSWDIETWAGFVIYEGGVSSSQASNQYYPHRTKFFINSKDFYTNSINDQGIKEYYQDPITRGEPPSWENAAGTPLLDYSQIHRIDIQNYDSRSSIRVKDLTVLWTVLARHEIFDYNYHYDPFSPEIWSK